MQLNGGAPAAKRYPKNVQGIEAVGLGILGNEKLCGVVSAVCRAEIGGKVPARCEQPCSPQSTEMNAAAISSGGGGNK
jgi:hypothetical protein